MENHLLTAERTVVPFDLKGAKTSLLNFIQQNQVLFSRFSGTIERIRQGNNEYGIEIIIAGLQSEIGLVTNEFQNYYLEAHNIHLEWEEYEDGIPLLKSTTGIKLIETGEDIRRRNSSGETKVATFDRVVEYGTFALDGVGNPQRILNGTVTASDSGFSYSEAYYELKEQLRLAKEREGILLEILKEKEQQLALKEQRLTFKEQQLTFKEQQLTFKKQQLAEKEKQVTYLEELLRK